MQKEIVLIERVRMRKVFQFKKLSADFVSEIPSMGEAIRVCQRLSGKRDKQIYAELGISQVYWTRIVNGNANLPADKLVHFMQICGNEVPLHWLAYQLGYEIKTSGKRDNS